MIAFPIRSRSDVSANAISGAFNYVYGIASDVDFALTLYTLLGGFYAHLLRLCQQERDLHVAAYVCARVMCHVWITTCITITNCERDVITVNCLAVRKGKKKRRENLCECNYET